MDRKINYRDLQKIAKKLRLPGNLKYELLYEVVKARRQGNETLVQQIVSHQVKERALRKKEKQRANPIFHSVAPKSDIVEPTATPTPTPGPSCLRSLLALPSKARHEMIRAETNLMNKRYSNLNHSQGEFIEYAPPQMATRQSSIHYGMASFQNKSMGERRMISTEHPNMCTYGNYCVGPLTRPEMVNEPLPHFITTDRVDFHAPPMPFMGRNGIQFFPYQHQQSQGNFQEDPNIGQRASESPGSETLSAFGDPPYIEYIPDGEQDMSYVNETNDISPPNDQVPFQRSRGPPYTEYIQDDEQDNPLVNDHQDMPQMCLLSVVDHQEIFNSCERQCPGYVTSVSSHSYVQLN